MKDIWVDFLCRGSVLKIIFLSRKFSIRNIYYINTNKRLSLFFVWVLKKLLRKSVVCADWIVESDEKIDNTSLYELIQLKLTDTLEKWISQEEIAKQAESYCRKNRYHPIKFKEHLKEAAYPHVFKLVEMNVFAKKVSGEENSLYIFRKTPLSSATEIFLDKKSVFFYDTHISHLLSIQNRQGYILDSVLNPTYFSDRFDSLGRISMFCIGPIVNIILCRLLGKDRQDMHVVRRASNIGIELLQSRVRLDEINDVYWMQNAGTAENSVWGIEHEEYDEKSKHVLASLGIRRCKVIRSRNPFSWFSLIKKNRNNECRYVTITTTDWLKTMPHMLRLFLSLLFWDERGWLQYQQSVYGCEVIFWESVYRQLGIKMVWSMYDVDCNKLAKVQALERVDGLYIGGHWSNYAMDFIDAQKLYDVLFVWGHHFKHNIFVRYPFMEVFQTGYPLDYYFESKKPNAIKLRKKYPGKFILSYHDNAMCHDIMCSKKMQLEIHKLFISMIEKNDNLVVFLKPKRKRYLEMIIEELPDLGKYINEGRIAIFLGDTPRTKVSPAEIGIASDLAVGLGISTAAAECYFAGTVSFHADLTSYEKNEFGNNGLNAVVFRDIESLEKAMQGRITGENALTHHDYRNYYEMLDPFQDGKAYIRTGFVIAQIQKAFQEGLSREEAVKKARVAYNNFLSERQRLDGYQVYKYSSIAN